MADDGEQARDLDVWLRPFLAAMGRKTRRHWAPFYLRGLLGPGDRKSLQPMAARLGLAKVLRRLQTRADGRGALDWDLHFVDATVVCAHQHAARARRIGALGGEGTVDATGEALGRSQGGFSTKLHLRAEGGGKPMAAVLTAGERHEQVALEAVMDKGAVPRIGRVRPRLRPRCTAGDRGYSSPTARQRLKQRGVESVIPPRKDQPRQRRFDKAAYRERNRVERLIGRLKQFRRLATRYEKRAANYLATVTLGMVMLWLT